MYITIGHEQIGERIIIGVDEQKTCKSNFRGFCFH